MQQISRPGGFSLLEVLVVMAVMGIVMASAIHALRLAYHAGPEPLYRQVQRAVVLASDRAVTTHRAHRVHFSPQGWILEEQVKGIWSAIPVTDRVHGVWAAGSVPEVASGALIVDPVGLVSPAVLRFRQAGQHVALSVSPTGEVHHVQY